MNLETQLAQLESAQLVRRAPDEDLSYLFKHALTQESAYESLLLKTRREIHRRVAQAYEQVYSERLDEHAPLLAQHYAEAGDDAKTLEYATRAGNQAARVYANAEALTYYTQALAVAQRGSDNSAQLIQLFSKRGRIFELMGKYDQALANYDEMETLAQARDDRSLELGALMARATILSTPTAQFNPVQARELSERSLMLARELNDRASEAKILWNLMLLAHFSVRYADAIVYGEQSIALARELNLREQLAYSLNDISRPYMGSNQLERGLAALREEQALWRALDNQPMLADNLNTLSTAALFSGDYDRTLALCREAYRLGHTINNPWSQAHSLMNTSLIYLDRGEVERAVQTMEECLRLAQQVGFFVAEGSMRALLAMTYASMGNLPGAFEFLKLTRAPEERAGAWEAGSLGILAQLYVLQGDLDQARDLVRQSYLALEHAPPTPLQNFSTFFADAELALAKQDYERAAAISDQLQAMMGQYTPPFYHITWFYLEGRVLYGQRRMAEAEQVLNQARVESERVGSRFYLWRILALLGDMEKQRGNPSQAAVLYAQAGEILEFIAAHTPAQYRESFLNLAEVKQVMNDVAIES
jgi:tetratricopeptide (TPR) repeat protein